MHFILISIAALSQLVSGQIHVCRKKNYDRGVGKVRATCLEGESRKAGLCYTDCKDGYNPFVTRCIMQCQGEYPVRCGLEFCAASKDDCARIVLGISAASIGGAVLGGVFVPKAVAAVGASAGGLGLGSFAALRGNSHCPW